jgi:acetyl-CoA carboxylase carboxyl transferase subunit beta
MIDMVVHRHKMRETLSRVCQLLMVRLAQPKTADRSKGRRLNGLGYVNGKPVDANLIEAVSRAPSEPAIEPEILGPEQRFDASRLESREKARKGEEAPASRSLTKDGQHH